MKKHICVLLAAIVLFMSACEKSTESAHETESEVKTPLELAVEEMESYYNDLSETEADEEYLRLLGTTVPFSEEAAQKVAAAAASMETNYVYSELYDVKTAYALYQKLKPYNADIQPILKSGQVDADELFELVKSNTENYLNAPDTPLGYSALDDEIVQHACRVIAWTVNEELKNAQMRDNIADLSANLQNLSIITGVSVSNAAINSDGSMTMNPGFMKTMNAIADNENAYDEIISHEVEHLFQRLCDDAREHENIDSCFGFAYEFNDLKVNSLYNRWFTEACAEMMASDLYNMEPVTYSYKIGYVNSLNFVSSLRADFDSVAVPRLSIKHDLDSVMEIFGCRSEEEKQEFLNVMYAINIIQEEPDDFLKAYKTEFCIDPAEELSEEQLSALRLRIKVGVCEYLSKTFYGNLANRLVGSHATLEEIFTLISIFESDLNNHISYYTSEEKYEFFKDFLNRYADLQDTFITSLAADINISADELLNSYRIFNGRVEIQKKSSLYETQWKQINISWLTTSQSSLVQTVYENTVRYKTISIQEYLKLRENM